MNAQLTKTKPRTRQDADAEQRIGELARRQHGVVTRAQLLEAGLAADQVDRRLSGQRLRLLHRGVYLAGPLVAPLTREMSAVLACGYGAVVSHASAAAIWQLPVAMSADQEICSDGRAYRSESAVLHDVHVTIRGGRRRCRPGVRVHRTDLRPDEMTTYESVPVTTPARTLIRSGGRNRTEGPGARGGGSARAAPDESCRDGGADGSV